MRHLLLFMLGCLWLYGTYTTAQIQEARLEPSTDSTQADTTQNDSWWDQVFRTSDIEGEKSARYNSNSAAIKGKKIGCVCMDYDVQDNAGRGACGGHGGVRFWLYKTPNDSIAQQPTDRHKAHPKSLSEQEVQSLAVSNEKKHQHPAPGLQVTYFYQLLSMIIAAILAALGIKKISEK